MPNESGWTFTGYARPIPARFPLAIAPGISVPCMFDECMTEEQIQIVTRLMVEDKIVPGRYVTWSAFAAAHALPTQP